MFRRYLAVFSVAALLTGVGGLLPAFQTARADTSTAAPTGLVATPASNSVSLSWNPVSNASTTSGTLAGYNVVRNGSQVASTTATGYLDSGLSPSTTYAYNVSAFDSVGSTSPWSDTLFVTTLASGSTSTPTTTAPTVPTGLMASSSSSSMVNLSWTASTDNSYTPSQLTYIVYRNGSQIATTSAGTVIFADTGLTAGTAYSYTVAAMDPDGNMSAQSGAVSATTLGGSSGSGTPSTTPSTGTFGWIIIPQSLYNQVFNASSSTSTTGSIYTYINGYPTINGNYYDCYGNIDNDMGHHSTDPNDTDPAHHSGQNCSGGAPLAPSMSGLSSGMGMTGSPQTLQSFFSPGTGIQWVIIPLNAQTTQALWQAIDVNGISPPQSIP